MNASLTKLAAHLSPDLNVLRGLLSIQNGYWSFDPQGRRRLISAGEPWIVAAHIGIGLSCFILLSSVLLLFLDEDASEELENTRNDIEWAREVQDQVDEMVSWITDFEGNVTRSNELYLAMRSMKETIERTISLDEINMQRFSQSMLDTSGRSLTLTCGLSLEQHYTICIYEARYDPAAARSRLHCIAHIRSIPCELSNARVWDSGDSVVGIAHSSAQEVLIPDMADIAVGTGFRVSNPKPDDDRLYRSMAAVPVRWSGSPLPWGVVIATSSEPDLFSSHSEGGVRPAEAVRALSDSELASATA